MNKARNGRLYRRAAAGTTALVVLISVAACGDDNEPDSNGAASASSEVTMRLIAFRPESLEAKTGTAITWTQEDAGAHTVTSGAVEQGGSDVTTKPDGRFDSGQLATGRTFRFTFDAPGIYPYFCAIHPATMRGEIRIA